MFPQCSGQFEEFQSFLQCDGFDALSRSQVREARFFFVLRRSDLHEWSVASDFHRDRFSVGRVCSQQSFSRLVVGSLLHRAFHHRLQLVVEVADEFRPVHLALCHLVKVLFDVCREVVVHDFREIFHEEVIHHRARVRGHQFASVASRVFRQVCRGEVSVFQDDFAIGAG